jgi:hypothetical protein
MNNVYNTAEFLRAAGFTVVQAISSTDEQLEDSEVSLVHGYHVQVGDGYFMIWHVANGKHRCYGEIESTNLNDLLNAISIVIPKHKRR